MAAEPMKNHAGVRNVNVLAETPANGNIAILARLREFYSPQYSDKNKHIIFRGDAQLGLLGLVGDAWSHRVLEQGHHCGTIRVKHVRTSVDDAVFPARPQQSYIMYFNFACPDTLRSYMERNGFLKFLHALSEQYAHR